MEIILHKSIVLQLLSSIRSSKLDHKVIPNDFELKVVHASHVRRQTLVTCDDDFSNSQNTVNGNTVTLVNHT